MNRPSLRILLTLTGFALLLAPGTGCQDSEEPAPGARVTADRTDPTTGTATTGTATTGDAATGDAATGDAATGDAATGTATTGTAATGTATTGDGALAAVVHGFELSATSPGDPAKTLEQGLSLQKQGKYKQAIDVLATAVAMRGPDKVRAEALFELAETHFRQGKDAQSEKLDPGEEADADAALTVAADLFEEVVRRYPEEMDSTPLAAYMTGSSYLLLGDQRTALEKYTGCYERFPNSSQRPRSMVRRGVCFAGTGNPAKAREIYRQYLDTYGTDAKLAGTTKKVRKYLREIEFVGRKAPPLHAERWLKGVIPRGLKDLQGEVVVLTFFMTGCGHCKNEMPKIRRDVERWTSHGVIFIGCSDPEHRDAKTPIDVYLNEHRIDFFDVAIDTGSRNQKPYHVRSFPASVIIGRKGIVRWRGHYAFLSHNLLEMLLAE